MRRRASKNRFHGNRDHVVRVPSQRWARFRRSFSLPAYLQDDGRVLSRAARSIVAWFRESLAATGPQRRSAGGTRWARTALAGLEPLEVRALLTAVSTLEAADLNSGVAHGEPPVCSTAVDTTTDVIDVGGVNSLREAIICANNTPGPDIITLAAGTYTLSIAGVNEDNAQTGDLDITESLTIQSQTGNPADVTINANGIDRVFDIDGIGGSSDVTFNGVTITGGSVGNTNSDAVGGGIRAEDFHSLSIQQSVISGNAVSTSSGYGYFAYGGGISALSNFSPSPAGGVGLGNGSTSSINISGSTISGNVVTTDSGFAFAIGGGALLFANNVSVHDSTISGNAATTAVVPFEGPYALVVGGGAALVGDSIQVTGSTISTNSVSVEPSLQPLAVPGGINQGSDFGTTHGFGGGLALFGPAIIHQSTISSNTVTGLISTLVGGGGIHHGPVSFGKGGFLDTGPLTIQESTISLNSVTQEFGDFVTGQGSGTSGAAINSGGYADAIVAGGGIFSYAESPLSVVNSTISTNTLSTEAKANTLGGGIFALNPVPRIESSTITGNTAAIGGGVYVYSLIEAGLAGQPGAGGAVNTGYNPSPLIPRNTIIAGNTALVGPDVFGDVNSNGYNLVGDATDSSGFGATGDKIGSDASPIDPLLGPLQDNGGPTLTHELLTGSPAIDMGHPTDKGAGPDTDQRGIDRPDGDPQSGGIRDIGAFEVIPEVIACSLVVTTNTDVVSNADAVNSLREAIICANTTPGPDTITLPADTYTLTIPGTEEDAAATGDLDITDPLTITGAGAATTVIDAGGIEGLGDRVFHIHSGSGTVNLSDVAIQGGFADGQTDDLGGGIFNFTTLNLQDVVVTQNTAERGGGIYHAGLEGEDLTATRLLLTQNHADKGGGFLNNSGDLVIVDSTISGNTADTQGGGGINTGASMTLTGSTVSGNRTYSYSGAGIFNRAPLSATNSTISGNNSAYNGGGINNTGGGTLDLVHVTIANNMAGEQGGGIYDTTENVDMGSSIVAGNSDIGDGPDIFGDVNSQGYNLIQNTTGTTITGDTTGNITGQDPLLGPLQNNGGPTETHELLTGSPAIDAANSNSFPSTDQRGVGRPIDGDGVGGAAPDIGAFEAPEVEIIACSLIVSTTSDAVSLSDGVNSLREAIICANETPGHDTITLAAATYTLTITGGGEDGAATGDLDITDSLTISGSGAGTTIIDAGGLEGLGDRVFHVLGETLAEFQGVAIRGGSGVQDGAGILNEAGNLTIMDSTIAANTASGNGARGGGLFFSGGTATIGTTVVSNNSANTSSESDDAEGGGIFHAGDQMVILSSTISGNTADADESFGQGGGIFNAGTSLTISDTHISGNTATAGDDVAEGGGIFNAGTSLVIEGSNISQNRTSSGDDESRGGGIFNAGTTVTITDTTISGNTATGGGESLQGGGIFNTGGVLSINRSTLSGNAALGDTETSGSDFVQGGGIWNVGDQVTITNSTISGNTAASAGTETYGGGIFHARFAGNLTIESSTITGNTASDGGGGIYVLTDIAEGGGSNETGGSAQNTGKGSYDAPQIHNSIIAGNSAASGPDFSGGALSQGYNLVGDGTGSLGFGATGDKVGDNITPIDPLLGPLQNNGGPTQTHALQPGSPAIDMADPELFPQTDQRGVGRPLDGDGNGEANADIGAYEAATVFTELDLSVEPMMIFEGETVTVFGEFGAGEGTHTVTINWGDGQTTEIDLAAGDGTFSSEHKYRDEDPSGTTQDPYTITATVTNDIEVTQTVMIIVKNRPPFFPSLVLNPGTVPSGGQTTIAGTYTDPGELDTHLLDVDLDNDGNYEFIGFPVTGGTFDFNIPVNLAPGTYDVNVRIRDDDTAATSFMTTIVVVEAGQTVADVHLFYNDSVHDGNGAAVDAADFDAIDPTKEPLLFGGTATFDNVSGSDKGVNGIFIDVPVLPLDGAGITAADIMVMVGNDNLPDTWAAGPAPASVGVLADAAPDGGDRIYVTFANGAIIDTWARFTIKANANTGLLVDQDFFFGSVGADTGAAFIGQGQFFGRAAEDMQSMAQEGVLFQPAAVDNPNDVNRDGIVNAFDLQLIPVLSHASNNGGAFHSNVILAITPQQGAAGLADVAPIALDEAVEQAASLLPPSVEVPDVAPNVPTDQRVGSSDNATGRDLAFATFAESEDLPGSDLFEALASGRSGL